MRICAKTNVIEREEAWLVLLVKFHILFSLAFYSLY